MRAGLRSTVLHAVNIVITACRRLSHAIAPLHAAAPAWTPVLVLHTPSMAFARSMGPASEHVTACRCSDLESERGLPPHTPSYGPGLLPERGPGSLARGGVLLLGSFV